MKNLKAILFALLSIFVLPISAQTNIVMQPQFGKQTITVPIGETLTFYDHKGTENIRDSYINNAQSLTVFKPADTEYAIEICFEEFDVANGDDKPYTTTGWHGFVKIYNGVCDADNSFSWETDVYGVTDRPQLPEGEVIEVLCGNYTNKTIISTSTDGVLSVGLLWKRGAECKGWTAKVRCVKPETMKSIATGSYYNYINTNPRTKSNIALANLYIDTEGELNPDYLNTIRFKLTDNQGVVNPSSIRLQTKDKTDEQASSPINVNIEADGNEYVMTLDHPLDKGHNTFTLLSDFLTDAKPGSNVSLSITSVETKYSPTGIVSHSFAVPSTVYCPGIILMSKDTTVVVGDYPLDFFDDGGLEGDATPYFVGKVTFMPDNPNKAVQIDFTKVRLFPAAPEGHYGQYIRVYNGTAADERNFLQEIKSYSQETIRSSSPDGALTVTYESTVSAKDEGFEAKVSQEATTTMEIKDIKVTQIVGNSVSPSEKDVQLLRILITTEGNIPPLKVDNLKFSTNNTFANIECANLYYTLGSYDFCNDNRIGKATIDSDEFTIQISDNITLIEGDNLLWLTLDIDKDVENGKRVDARLMSACFNGISYNVTDGNPYGDRLVMHTVLSHKDQGTVTSIVNQSLIFKNKGFMDIYDAYEWGEDARINIFMPMHDGLMCKIDFEKFQLYYSDNEDGVKPTFIVYNGKGTTGDILWQVNSYSDATNGPEMPIVSTSADGCLTILFNPNAEKFSYTSEGFIAHVTEINPNTPTIKLNHNLLTTNLGGNVTAQAYISGGETPYHIKWMNAKHEIVGEQSSDGNASFTFAPTICDDYIVYVTDKKGIPTEATFRVVVLEQSQTATFENLYLEPESFCCGNSHEGSFVSGTYEFSNGYIPEWNFWHGFAYSNQTSTSYANMMPDQFNSAAGGGYNGSENFAVVYAQDLTIKLISKKKETINGFYVTNDSWVVNAILNGDGIVDGGFHKGDHLRLRIKGKHTDGSEDYLDFYLADYHSDNEEDHYYLDSWQWVDLRPLGEVTELTFEMGSTKGNLYGMTTPAYFCMDNFNGQREETIINIRSTNVPIDLNQYLQFEHPTASISYVFADTTPAGMSLSENGILTTQPYQEASVVIKATQRGKQQFLRLNIGDGTSIESRLTNPKEVIRTYDIQGRELNNLQPGLNIIVMPDGTTRKIVK